MHSPAEDHLAMTDADCYRMVRSQIEFEAGLISQRLSWFVASQAFLFSAYAITLNAPRDPASAAFREQQHLVYLLLPMVAVACGALIYLAILAGLFAQVRLRRFLVRRVLPERLVQFPPVQGGQQTHLLGALTHLGLPLIFIAVWVYLAVRGLH